MAVYYPKCLHEQPVFAELGYRWGDFPEAERLQQAGIDTMIHYPVPPHLQPAYAELGYSAGVFPLTEAIPREVLSLPMGPHLNQAQ